MTGSSLILAFSYPTFRTHSLINQSLVWPLFSKHNMSRCGVHSLRHALWLVGCGGVLVESMRLDRRVVGSNPVLAATKGLSSNPSLTVACNASACKRRHSFNCCGRERF